MIPRPAALPAVEWRALLEREVRPAALDLGRIDAVHDDELRPAGRSGHEPDRAAADAEGIGEDPEHRVVCGSLDGRRRDVDAQDAVDDAVDVIRGRPGGEPDGESDLGGVQRAGRPCGRGRRLARCGEGTCSIGRESTSGPRGGRSAPLGAATDRRSAPAA